MTDEKESIFTKYKKLLIGGSASIGAFTSVVFTYIDAKTEAIAEQVKLEISHNRIQNEQKSDAIEKQLERIENVLIRIDDRVYNLTRKPNRGE